MWAAHVPALPGTAQDCPGGHEDSAQQVASTQLPERQSLAVSQPAPFGAGVGVSVAVGVPDGDAVGVAVCVAVAEGEAVGVSVGVDDASGHSTCSAYVIAAAESPNISMSGNARLSSCLNSNRKFPNRLSG